MHPFAYLKLEKFLAANASPKVNQAVSRDRIYSEPMDKTVIRPILELLGEHDKWTVYSEFIFSVQMELERRREKQMTTGDVIREFA